MKTGLRLPPRKSSARWRACLAATGLLAVLAAGLLSLSAFLPTIPNSPLATAIVRTPTRASLFTPTPTPTRALPGGFSFSEIISFYPGAGGYDPCLDNLDFDLDTLDPNEPLVYLHRGHEYDLQREIICLSGFPPGEIVNLQVQTPGGRLAGSYSIQIGENTGMAGNFEGIDFDLMPLTLPNGRWKITAISQSASASSVFDHPASKPSLTLSHPVPSSMPLLDPRRTTAFQPGEILQVQGANLPARRDLPLGIYFVPGEYFTDDAQFVTGKTVRADGFGRFQVNFVLPKNLPAGKYYVILFSDPKQTFFYQDDMTMRFQIYRPWRPSPDCPASNLHNGDQASVVFGAICPRIFGGMLLYPGQQVSITSEPYCQDGILSWYASRGPTHQGWLPESVNGQPCLLPHNY